MHNRHTWVERNEDGTKREIRVVLESFLARFREFRLAPGADCPFHTGVVIGMDILPLEWRRA